VIRVAGEHSVVEFSFSIGIVEVDVNALVGVRVHHKRRFYTPVVEINASASV